MHPLFHINLLFLVEATQRADVGAYSPMAPGLHGYMQGFCRRLPDFRQVATPFGDDFLDSSNLFLAE